MEVCICFMYPAMPKMGAIHYYFSLLSFKIELTIQHLLIDRMHFQSGLSYYHYLLSLPYYFISKRKEVIVYGSRFGHCGLHINKFNTDYIFIEFYEWV